MPTTFRPCAPDQSLLFPPCPRDWLPEGHLAFFIADTVATLDLHKFYEPYESDGRRNQPFDPEMMVQVLLYAYATGTFSSRRIAKKLEEDVAYRVLAAGNVPAHRTIAEFRQAVGFQREGTLPFQNLSPPDLSTRLSARRTPSACPMDAVSV